MSLIPRGQPLADISLAVKARDVSEGRGGEGRAASVLHPSWPAPGRHLTGSQGQRRECSLTGSLVPEVCTRLYFPTLARASPRHLF